MAILNDPIGAPGILTLPQWTVLTAEPTRSERWATRIFSAKNTGNIWVILPVLLNFGMQAMSAWTKRDYTRLALNAVAIAATFLLWWERKGFVELLERYDAELRSLRRDSQS